MDDAKKIGDRIRRLRKQMGYTQADMAEHIKCSESNYQKIESGKIGVSIPLLTAIAGVLETSMDYLVLGEGAGIERRIEKLLEGRNKEELEYIYRILYVILKEMPTIKE